MKSLNTKKIVAMATGAALLGSALLGAVSYQNTELINENGVPMAKVVVGSNAHISDGVAAANIAAVLGNMAFKSVAVEATVSGINGLSCDVSGEGAGTCDVLSKSVDLEVVTPAGTIPAGAYGFSTLIGDYIDAQTENRNNTNPSDKEETPFSVSSADKIEEAAIKIGASEMPSVFGDFVVRDPQSSVSTVQKQALYLKHDGSNRMVKYDAADNRNYFVAERTKMAYEIEFETPGIPVCSDSKNGYWAYCTDGLAADLDTDKALENHRVNIKFLGKEWIISELNPVDIGSPDHAEEGVGGSIKIADILESAYSPKLQIGESLDLGDGNTLVLGDLKPASGGQTADIAIFSVMNAAGEEIASRTVSQGETTEIVAGSDTYRVRVYQVAPGYTLTEKWAEVAVFANELELKHNQNLDGDNSGWRVKLVWRNEDENTYHATYNNMSDHLTSIVLYERNTKDLLEGDSRTIIEDPALWRLTFTGLDLVSDDYTRVNLDVESAGTMYYNLTMSGVKDASSTDEFRTGNEENNDDTVIRIYSNDKIFRVYDVADKRFDTDEIIISPFGYTNASDHYFNQSVFLGSYDGSLIPLQEASDVYYSSGDKWYKVEFGFNSTGDVVTYGNVNTTYESNVSDIERVNVKFYEDIGNNQEGHLFFRAFELANDSGEMEFAVEGTSSSSTAAEKIRYASDTGFVDGTHKAPFYTERGSLIYNADETNIEYRVAGKVGELTFLLQSTGAETSEEGAMPYSNLHEGDEISVLGATVRVKNINVETSACEVEGGEGVVTGVEGLSCVINANVANLGERQDIPTDLVVMDRAAANVETVIAVGGPMVNDVTAALLATESPLQSAGDVFVEEVGAGKIVVAGYTADDTMTAAMNFIAALKGQ